MHIIERCLQFFLPSIQRCFCKVLNNSDDTRRYLFEMEIDHINRDVLHHFEDNLACDEPHFQDPAKRSSKKFQCESASSSIETPYPKVLLLILFSNAFHLHLAPDTDGTSLDECYLLCKLHSLNRCNTQEISKHSNVRGGRSTHPPAPFALALELSNYLIIFSAFALFCFLLCISLGKSDSHQSAHNTHKIQIEDQQQNPPLIFLDIEIKIY